MDCMEGMAQFPDKYFDLAIVDPPYGIKRDEGFEGFEGFGGFGKPIARKRYKGGWDDKPPSKEYFIELERISINQIIWGGQFFTDKIKQSGHWIFWDKINTMPTFGDGELAYTSFNRGSVKRFIFQYNGLLGKEPEERINATQKPIALYKWLLKNYAKPEFKIIDTHAGSCSSVIAFLEFGCQWIAFEIDKDYYQAASKRIENYKLQLKLF